MAKTIWSVWGILPLYGIGSVGRLAQGGAFMTSPPPVAIGKVLCGTGQPLTWIAGPCVIETHDLTLFVADALRQLADRLKLPLIFKASFDKANRTSGKSFRGPGLDAGLKTLDQVKQNIGLPVTTDLHETSQVDAVAQVGYSLQIPAALARQTDVMLAAGGT